MGFDPYEQWLRIPPGRRPPSYYDLLGLSPDETDLRRIEQAAAGRYEHVRKYVLGPQGDQADRMLAEISEAAAHLTDRAKSRARYVLTLPEAAQPAADGRLQGPARERISGQPPAAGLEEMPPWRRAARILLAVPRAVDRILCTVAGEGNTILHNFFRGVALIAAVATAVVLSWPTPEHPGPPLPQNAQAGPQAAKPPKDDLPEEDLLLLDDSFEESDELQYAGTLSHIVGSRRDLLSAVMAEEQLNLYPDEEVVAAAVAVGWRRVGLNDAPRSDLLATGGSDDRSALSGRGSGRGALVAKSGGTSGSEKAVALALKWLAEHQFPDGGWSFDHGLAPNCGGKCRNPGSATKARIGATAMALLPFLGAGQTHKEGKYKQTVKGGLDFLRNHMKLKPQGGDLWEQEGRMYSHGLASIALCEAYAMTLDKSLGGPAQAALNFICYAQDPVGGGWRYQPRQKGDTSVFGWQIAALKRGHTADLRVPPITVKKAYSYLDSVQADSGATYGYTGPGEGPATTAIGLLGRMYLGWERDNPALQRGVRWLSSKGPSPGNMYYNYYATQVMRHWEGQEWKKWNGKMRDQLVNSQVQNKDSHELGSWFVRGGDHGSRRGGRLYCTSLGTLILEIYYRNLPIYGKQAVERPFSE